MANKKSNKNGGKGRGKGKKKGMSSNTQWTLLAVGSALVVVIAIVATSVSGNQAGSVDPRAFDLPEISDTSERILLSDYAGTPVVVNFFASWCTACEAELPGFATVSREFEGQVAFVGVNSQETGNRLDMPERHGITWWDLARDINGRNESGLHQRLGGRGMPITAFYDAEGNLVDVANGVVSESDLRQRLASFYGIT